MNTATEGLVRIFTGRLFHKLQQKTPGDLELWAERCIRKSIRKPLKIGFFLIVIQHRYIPDILFRLDILCTSDIILLPVGTN